MQGVAAQVKFAKELHERVRREFPEVGVLFNSSNAESLTIAQLRIYRIKDKPIGRS